MGVNTEPREILPYDPYIDTIQPVRPEPPDPRLGPLEQAFARLGVTDTTVRRGRAPAGIPWLAVGAIAVVTAVVFALLNTRASFVSMLVGLLYAAVIALLILVLLRSALAIRVEHRPIAGVVAIGGAVLVVVFWVLVHFITVSSELFTVDSLWRSAVLAAVGIALAIGATRKDAATREWLAGPLRYAQVSLVGYPPVPPKPPKGDWKDLVRNPGATAMVIAAAVTGAVGAFKK